MIGGHYVLSDQKHTDRYVEKTRFLRRVDYLQILADMIAKAYSKKNIEVVIAPAVGGVGLAAIVAVRMMQAGFGAAGEIQWGYAEPFRGKDGELILYELKRGFAQMVEGKRVLVVEDVITTNIASRAHSEQPKRESVFNSNNGHGHSRCPTSFTCRSAFRYFRSPNGSICSGSCNNYLWNFGIKS